ncbi:MAG: hypothetical protein AAB336_14150 [Acidobacteriota bacterium]
MGETQKKPSTSWAISGGLSISGGAGKASAGALGLTLLDLDAQIFFPLSLKLSNLGAGLPFGLTVATFSPTFFKTPKPLWVNDFNVRGFFANAELCVFIGGALAYLTFTGINHSPFWLDIGGLESGLAAGISAGQFTATASDKEGKSNNGCIISPDGDPLCGNASKAPNSSKASNSSSSSKNMSR